MSLGEIAIALIWLFVLVVVGVVVLRALARVGRRSGLVRPREGRIVAGVCGALANRYGWSVHMVRLAFVASIVLPGSQLLVYVALWVFLPSAPREGAADV